MVTNLSSPWVAFPVAYTLVMAIFVYLLRMPQWLTGNENLVNEYYVQRPGFSFAIDFVLVGLYGLFAYVVWTLLGFQTPGKQALVVAIVTALLTGGFCFYFIHRPVEAGNFFSRWFHTVKYRSVLYDVVLLLLIYAVYAFLSRRAR